MSMVWSATKYTRVGGEGVGLVECDGGVVGGLATVMESGGSVGDGGCSDGGDDITGLVDHEKFQEN